MQCAARHTFSGKVVEELFERCSSSYQQFGSLVKGAMESTTMTNTTTRGSCYLHRSEKWHRMEVRTTRDLVQPMISIRQSVRSAHDRVPKRRGRDCPHWPRFATQLASGARYYIVYTSFAPLVHKSRTIFIS